MDRKMEMEHGACSGVGGRLIGTGPRLGGVFLSRRLTLKDKGLRGQSAPVTAAEVTEPVVC